MKFLGKQIDLAILDLDGTLFDSTSLWADIDRRFFLKRGMEVPKGYAERIAHLGLKEAACFTKREYGFPQSEEEIMAEWNAMSLEAYEKEIPAKPFAKEILECLKCLSVPLSLATANSPALYVPALKRLELLDYFSFSVDPSVCEGGKHDSRMYDACAAHFRVAKEHTLLFEDSLHPMKMAREAGYQVVGLYDEHSTKSVEECRRYCLHFTYSLKEIIDIIEEENPLGE